MAELEIKYRGMDENKTCLGDQNDAGFDDKACTELAMNKERAVLDFFKKCDGEFNRDEDGKFTEKDLNRLIGKDGVLTNSDIATIDSQSIVTMNDVVGFIKERYPEIAEKHFEKNLPSNKELLVSLLNDSLTYLETHGSVRQNGNYVSSVYNRDTGVYPYYLANDGIIKLSATWWNNYETQLGIERSEALKQILLYKFAKVNPDPAKTVDTLNESAGGIFDPGGGVSNHTINGFIKEKTYEIINLIESEK